MTETESARFGLAFDRRVLDGIAGRAAVTVLHVHGRDIFFDQVVSLPVHAINWHDRITAPTLAAATGLRVAARHAGRSPARRGRDGQGCSPLDPHQDRRHWLAGRLCHDARVEPHLTPIAVESAADFRVGLEVDDRPAAVLLKREVEDALEE